VACFEIKGMPQYVGYGQIVFKIIINMQLMHQKQSQSEALKNPVERIPVKERQKLSSTFPLSVKSNKGHINSFDKARLDLEIAAYWLLSKCIQTRRRYILKTSKKV